MKLSEFQFHGCFMASPEECATFFQHLLHFYRNISEEPRPLPYLSKRGLFLFLTKDRTRLSLGGCPVRGDRAPSPADGLGTGLPVEDTSTRGDSLVVGHEPHPGCQGLSGATTQLGVLGSLKTTLGIYLYTDHRGRSLSSLDIVRFLQLSPHMD